MDKIVLCVKKLVKTYGSNNPFIICNFLDISIINSNLPNKIKSFYVKFFKSKIIYLNSNIKHDERLYACAYELGNAVLNEEISSIYINKESDPYIKNCKDRAKYFAECLLSEHKNNEKNKAI